MKIQSGILLFWNYIADSCAASNPCQNGGHCFPQDTASGYQCMCKAKYIGKECEEGKWHYISLSKQLYNCTCFKRLVV